MALGEDGGPPGTWREQSGVTRRNRVDNTVNIKAEVETSLLEDTQLQYGVALQLHFAANMKEGKKHVLKLW